MSQYSTEDFEDYESDYDSFIDDSEDEFQFK